MIADPKVTPISISGNFVKSEGDFSLVLGGPLYQLYLRTRLSTPPLGLLRRRVLAISLVCWFPLLLLSLAGGHAIAGVPVPFLSDVEAHVRFLVALPLLIVAEPIVHQRIARIVNQFLTRHIITSEQYERFMQIINSTMRLRNSIFIEIALLVFAFSVADWIWQENLALRITSWYALKSGSESHLSAAGYWYALVSLPVFRFILFRWYFRLFLWYQFLWRVRALPLHLNLFHPDRAAGLGFLTGSVLAFAPVLLAHTTFLAGFIGERIWHAGATLMAFKMEIVGSVLLLVLLVLTPLSFFVVHLSRAGRLASREYGILASRYVDDFRRKWIGTAPSETEPLLGTPDLQSLADLGNAFRDITGIRLIPISKDTVIRLAAILVLPILPLTLTMVPLARIVDWLLKLAI